MTPQLILRIVGLVTAALILLLGILLVTGSILNFVMAENTRILLGVMIIVYSVYRFYTLLRKPSCGNDAEE